MNNQNRKHEVSRKMLANFEGPIHVVGGAPRSGTTVTHALICTSKRVNNYHPEISYVRPIVEAYPLGLGNWQNHTRAFFLEKEHFRLHMRNVVNVAFSQIHRSLGTPEILCVKDPLLTPEFPALRDILRERVRFITVIRHPHDVVRSRQEVARKAGKAFTDNVVRAISREYTLAYRHTDDPAFGNQLYVFRYEDLLANETLTGLRAFTGCDDISPDNIWGARQLQEQDQDSSVVTPWGSPKYRRPIDLTSRLTPLDASYRSIVNDTCGALMERFAYDAAA